MSATAPMEAPIAADAPVDRPFELEDEDVLVAEAEDEDVLVAEAEEVFVAELVFTLEVGIAVAGGVSTVENAWSLIAPRVANEYLWPSWGAVIFELMAISALDNTSRCHAVPFAEFVKKNVPSPHGVICQNIELSDNVWLRISGTVLPAVVPL